MLSQHWQIPCESSSIAAVIALCVVPRVSSYRRDRKLAALAEDDSRAADLVGQQPGAYARSRAVIDTILESVEYAICEIEEGD